MEDLNLTPPKNNKEMEEMLKEGGEIRLVLTALHAAFKQEAIEYEKSGAVIPEALKKEWIKRNAEIFKRIQAL